MGFFGDEDEAFDLFVLHELDKQNKKSGGCMLSLLLVLLMCVVLTLTACGKEQPDQKEESEGQSRRRPVTANCSIWAMPASGSKRLKVR